MENVEWVKSGAYLGRIIRKAVSRVSLKRGALCWTIEKRDLAHFFPASSALSGFFPRKGKTMEGTVSPRDGKIN